MRSAYSAFNIPRAIMPQIEETDYPDFISYVEELGVSCVHTSVPPEQLHPRQELDEFDASRMPPEVHAKPILISADFYILDGNHRWMLYLHLNMQVEVIQLLRPFEEAIELMLNFPRTYQLANHPEKD